jgi:hypothetical protein
MPLVLSKWLLALEVVVLAVPTLLFVFFMFPVFIGGSLALLVGRGSAWGLLTLFMGLGTAVSLLAAHVAIFAFLRAGAEGLRSLNVWWWRLCVAGAVMSVAVFVPGLLRLAGHPVSINGDASDAMKYLASGIFYLPAFLHVFLERQLRRAVPREMAALPG